MDINDIIESLSPEEIEKINKRARILIEEEAKRHRGELWREYLESIINKGR